MGLVKLIFRNIDQAKDLDWIYTNWEISTARNFDRTKLVFAEYEDHVNKVMKRINIDLIPGKKYYGRAQVVTNKGAHEWVNLDVFTYVANDTTDNETDLPSRISSPDVYTNSDVNNHVPIGFSIKCRDFDCIGDGVHIATSYWIETLDHKVVWSSLYNETFLNEILVDDTILNYGTVYRVKAIFHSSSNDISQVSTRTIYVQNTTIDANALRISEAIKNKNFKNAADLNINLSKILGADSVEIKLQTYVNKSLELVKETTVDLTQSPAVLTLASAGLEAKRVYSLLLKYSNSDIWISKIFNTY